MHSYAKSRKDAQESLQFINNQIYLNILKHDVFRYFIILSHEKKIHISYILHLQFGYIPI